MAEQSFTDRLQRAFEMKDIIALFTPAYNPGAPAAGELDLRLPAFTTRLNSLSQLNEIVADTAAMYGQTAMDRAARERGVPLVLFIVPPGTVDPDYVDFWKPWPRFYAFNVIADYRQDRLLEALSGTSIRYVDLRKDFEGVRGAYRRSDAHWTDKGVEIAANRVFQELRRLERR